MKKLKLFFPLSIYNTVSTGRLVLGILLHVACFFLVPILTVVGCILIFVALNVGWMIVSTPFSFMYGISTFLMVFCVPMAFVPSLIMSFLIANTVTTVFNIILFFLIFVAITVSIIVPVYSVVGIILLIITFRLKIRSVDVDVSNSNNERKKEKHEKREKKKSGKRVEKKREKKKSGKRVEKKRENPVGKTRESIEEKTRNIEDKPHEKREKEKNENTQEEKAEIIEAKPKEHNYLNEQIDDESSVVDKDADYQTGFRAVPTVSHTCVSKTDDTNSEDAGNVDVEKISGDDLSI